MSDLKIVCLMLTAGRHYCAERSLSFFLDQDYPNKHLIIYQNSPIPQKLDDRIDPSLVTLINNNIFSETGKPYTSLGDIHNDALKYIPEDADVVNVWDDDDLRPKYFLSEGVKGYERAIASGKKAFKPLTCIFRTADGLSPTQNMLEGSWFVNAQYIRETGFKSGVNVSHHEGWTLPLINGQLFLSDDINTPNYNYCWGETIQVYKTSGAGETSDNFANYHRFSQEHGDCILSKIDVDKYYKEIEDWLLTRVQHTVHNK
jgi:hypothetical protein